MRKYRLIHTIIPLTAILLFITLISARVAPIPISTDGGEAAPIVKNESERITFLVGGTDRASGLTDVLMLVTAQIDTGNICVLQLPRDTYAAYTERSYKKLNGAYGALGGEGLSGLISESFDIEIDGYMILSPNAFRDVVDAIGGVEVDIKRTMYYNDPAQELYIYLKAGRQTLDGKTAEQFVRYRSGYTNGDLGRMDNQKIFMLAAARKLRDQVSQIEMLKVATSLMSGTDTNITPTQAAAFIDVLKGAREQNMTLLTAAGDSATAKSGASYYSLSAPAMKEILEIYFDGGKDFDRKRIFQNKNNSEFIKIYEGYSQYTPVRADEIEQKS